MQFFSKVIVVLGLVAATVFAAPIAEPYTLYFKR